MMITVSVFTLTGKSQDFTMNPQKLVAEFKSHVMRNHKYLMYPNGSFDANSEVRFLYKGIEMDEAKTLDDYSVCDGGRIQIVLKTKPMTITGSLGGVGGGGNYGCRRLSESLPIYEHYAPSPMDSTMLSRSSSPPRDDVADLRAILQQLSAIREDVCMIKEELLKRREI